MVTHEELVTPAPAGVSASALATVPSAFVSAALSYKFTGLLPGERVLIHAGAGGVGLAAIQLAQAAGAEVFATASAPKQAYLRSLGVQHVFDSRTTRFGEEVLEATGGEGVHVVLNSLTSEGFIEASLSCLARGGRFVELARRDILSEEEMAAVRPDVSYAILELDVMKKTEPATVGVVLRDVMARLTAGELTPIIHSRWPLAEAGNAIGVHAIGPARREDRPDALPHKRRVAQGPHIPGDRRSGRHRMRRGRLARGAGRRRHRAQRASPPGPRGRRSYRGAARTRRYRAGGDR